jgi:putative spermidine/putrescine transport system permease protein
MPPASGRPRVDARVHVAARAAAGAATVALSAAVLLSAGSLVVRAFADVWRAPALLPQQWGTRGFLIIRDSGAADALAVSLTVGVLTTAVALVIAWPAARVLGERRLRHPATVFLLLAMPLLVAPYAVGTGLSEWFLRLDLVGTLGGLVLAHLTLVLPYAVLLLLSGFGPDVRGLEEMGRAAGLSPGQRLRWVTVPVLRPTLAAASLLSFLVSWSQYGTSLAVAPTRPTLPVVLLPFVGADPQAAAALSLLFLAPALLALVAAVRAIRGGV